MESENKKKSEIHQKCRYHLFTTNPRNIMLMLVEHKIRSQHMVRFIHARIQKVLSEGDNVWVFCCFLVDEGRADTNTTISAPSSARQQNAIFKNGVSLACR